MARAKCNRFTLPQEVSRPNQSRSERMTTDGKYVEMNPKRQMHLADLRNTGPRKLERENTFTRRFWRKDGKKNNKGEDNRETQEKGDLSPVPPRLLPSKKANIKVFCATNNLKQKSCRLNGNGDIPNAMQENRFSDESLQCMNLIKAAIRDVVHQELSKVTGSRFQGINERLDQMSALLKNNEIAISNCVRDMQTKLKEYTEDTSGHLKYLCMKLEYEKLMLQNLKNFQLTEATQQQCFCNKSATCSNSSTNPGFYTHHQTPDGCNKPVTCNTKSIDPNPVIPSCNKATSCSSESSFLADFDPQNRSIQSILASFIHYKLNKGGSNPLVSESVERQLLFGESIDSSLNSVAQLQLSDILKCLDKNNPDSDGETVVRHDKKEDFVLENDDDGSVGATEDSNGSKSSSEEYEESYCDEHGGLIDPIED